MITYRDNKMALKSYIFTKIISFMSKTHSSAKNADILKRNRDNCK